MALRGWQLAQIPAAVADIESGIHSLEAQIDSMVASGFPGEIVEGARDELRQQQKLYHFITGHAPAEPKKKEMV